MNIHKFGHCCLLIKTGTKTVLTDPGTFTTGQDEVKGIDIILISHEHQDHFHIDSVKKVLANNPQARIVTNASVGKLLDAEGIAYDVVGEGQKNDAHGVTIEGYGHLHATIYESLGQVENTGYMLDGKLFYPGDAFVDPKQHPDILALPVAGPWMKLGEALDYAVMLKPRVAFPVHDGVLKNPDMFNKMTAMILKGKGIEFTPVKEGETVDL